MGDFQGAYPQRLVEAPIDKFEVSVVIPVYNAASYVRQAVESALAQPEVREVLLVEDGSPDNALAVCQELAAQNPQVVLLRHPNGENRGAGASRNLGMRSASCPFLAFLDADDFFLPGRFKRAKEIFENDPNCEGVYEAIGMFIEDELGWERWQDSGKPLERVKTIKEPIDPANLGIELIRGNKGHFSLDGLVIKKTVLSKAGHMDEGLRIHQDTNFIIKAALTAKLLPGSIMEPVTMWRVHQRNRVSAPKTKSEWLQDRMAFLYSTYSWTKNNFQTEAKDLLVKMMFSQVISIDKEEFQYLNKIHRVGKRYSQLRDWTRTHKEMWREPQFRKSLFLFIFSAGRRS